MKIKINIILIIISQEKIKENYKNSNSNEKILIK